MIADKHQLKRPSQCSTDEYVPYYHNMYTVQCTHVPYYQVGI